MAKTLAGKVRAAMRTTSIPKAEYVRSGMVRGWGRWTRGYGVKTCRGLATVGVYFHEGGSQTSDWQYEVMSAMAKIGLLTVRHGLEGAVEVREPAAAEKK